MGAIRVVTWVVVGCALGLLSGVPAWGGEGPESADLGPPPAPAREVRAVAAATTLPVVPAAPAAAEAPAAPPLPVLPAAPALPLDDEPPAPPAPPPPPQGEFVFRATDEELPLPPDHVEGELPLPDDFVPADDFVPPAEVTFERTPCGPAPCPRPSTPDCCWLRDDCGRPLDWCGNPIGLWDVTVEATGTDLEDPSGPLGVGRPGALSWGAHDYDPEFGGRVTIGYAFSRPDRFELRGGWSGIWRDAGTQTGVFGFTPPPGGTSPLVNANLKSRAELWGGEANWWRELCCRGSWRLLGAVGYRYVAFDERATVDAALAAAPFTPASVRATSENDFHFGQLALAVEKQLGRRFEVALSGKGLLGSVSRDVRVQDVNVLAGGAHAARNDDSDFAWGAELELTVSYKLSARVALTAGYTLLYLDAVVRAYDGMDFTQAATGVVQARQETDSLLAQSVFAGLRIRF